MRKKITENEFDWAWWNARALLCVIGWIFTIGTINNGVGSPSDAFFILLTVIASIAVLIEGVVELRKILAHND